MYAGADEYCKKSVIKRDSPTSVDCPIRYVFADKVSMKANSIFNAAARTSGTYKSNGIYNNALSELVSKKVDEEV